MGFLDQLRLNNIFNPQTFNQAEPLFGGLIPRREVVMPRMVEPGINTDFGINIPQPNITPQRGIDRLGTGMDSQVNQPMNVVYDYRPELAAEDRKLKREQLGVESELGRGKLGLERNKFGYEQSQDAKELALKSEIERGKLTVDQRKQALDEWKSRNPEGDIKVDDKGRLVVINKLTGKTIDTGLKSGDLTEEEKLKRNIIGQKEVEGIRQKGRIELEGVKEANRRPERINTLEMRRAEDDSAAELLRDERYSWLLGKGYVTVDSNGVQIKRPTGGGFFDKKQDIKDSNLVLDQFEKDIKTKASERLNQFYEKPDVTKVDTIKPESDMVDMIIPDPKGDRNVKVLKSNVENMVKLGAKVK